MLIGRFVMALLNSSCEGIFIHAHYKNHLFEVGGSITTIPCQW